MTKYSDMILKIVKLSVIIFALILISSISKLFIDIDETDIQLINSVLFYTYTTSIVTLFIYLYGSYTESKKLITCTGCKVVNYVGNFIAYFLISTIFYGVNALIW